MKPEFQSWHIADEYVDNQTGPSGFKYLPWVGIGPSLDGQPQRVRLGHGVIAVGTQQGVGVKQGQRQRVGALFSLRNILWRFQKGH